MAMATALGQASVAYPAASAACSLPFVKASTVLLARSQRCGISHRRSGNCFASRTIRKDYFSGLAVASMRDAEQLVQSGVVRNVGPEEVSPLLSQEGYKMLDVRPVWEREKAYVPGSYHVPLFVEDVSTGPLTLLKKAVQMGQGGWWIGLKLTVRNDIFFQLVEAAVPKGEKLLVVCGEGLRSLLAIEELYDGGFEQLAWLRGGFNNVKDDAIQNVEGPMRLRFATLGGASEYLLKIALYFQKLSNPSQKSES